MVNILDSESKIAVIGHTELTAAPRTDRPGKQHFAFSSTATPSARNPVTSLVCRARHAGTSAPASRGCLPWEDTDNTGDTTVLLMSRPSCCPSLEKTARVGVKNRAPCCAPYPLAWDTRPAPCFKLCWEEDCCPEVAPPSPVVACCCLPGGPNFRLVVQSAIL